MKRAFSTSTLIVLTYFFQYSTTFLALLLTCGHLWSAYNPLHFCISFSYVFAWIFFFFSIVECTYSCWISSWFCGNILLRSGSFKLFFFFPTFSICNPTPFVLRGKLEEPISISFHSPLLIWISCWFQVFSCYFVVYLPKRYKAKNILPDFDLSF